MEEQKLGKYEIRATIGRGAIGVVYEGWDPILARKVAIKTLALSSDHVDDAEKRSRFLREAQAAAMLHHPNIVNIFDYGEEANHAYIVMELVGGSSLETVLSQSERLSRPRVFHIMSGLLAGLQHSHECGIVHRDIKPGNILLTTDHTVKISDFGIAHLEDSTLTRMGSIMGTPAYMSPEQVLGESVDARTDLYSAGVVLYQMLAGKRPYEGGTASIMHKIVTQPVPPLPPDIVSAISPRIDSLLAKALAKKPGTGFRTPRVSRAR